MGRPVTHRTAEHPRPDHFLLHISDTHLLADGGRLYDRVATRTGFTKLGIEHVGAGPKRAGS